MFKKRLITQQQIPGLVGTTVFCLLGTLLFLLHMRSLSLAYTSADWFLLGSMLAASLVLYMYTFQVPPDGSKQSMDSVVYLACIFTYGSAASLVMLLVSAVIFAFIERKLAWWKHLLNFSIYSIMISGAGGMFHLMGGRQGYLQNVHLPAYFGALVAYFILNLICISLYYCLMYRNRDNLYALLKGLLRESMLVYLCILILSLVLTIMVVHNGVTGLGLFLGISLLLSHLFRMQFGMYQQVQERANTDQRTGLYNHTYFEQILDLQLQQARNTGKPLSLAMVDIDDFKKYNDHFGHLKGDRLLGLMGQILKEESEMAGISASRYGGEEFSLLMPGYDTQQALEFINRLRKRINDTPYEGVEIFPHGCLSFSAGISGYKPDIHDKSLLVDQADQALYGAKKQGKNTVQIFGESQPVQDEQDIAQDVKNIEQLLSLFLYKDIDTFKHSKRVFRYAMDMSKVLGLDPVSRKQFVLGALIHDIGKLEIPRDIIRKQGKLSPSEWETVKKHVVWGKEIALIQEPFKALVPYIELHHERYDGKGYPHGYQREEIPLLCRMLTVIDSFDAMTSERPYQNTKSVEDAIRELRACAGTQFDPDLTELFIRYIEARQKGKALPAADVNLLYAGSPTTS